MESVTSYEDKICALEFENKIFERSRDRSLILVGELQKRNELFEKENKELRQVASASKVITPKYYAKMRII